MKKHKIFLIPGDSVKTLVEFECLICGTTYQKETHVPVGKVKDLQGMKNFGICKECHSRLNDGDHDAKNKLKAKLREINIQIILVLRKDKDD